MTTAYPAHPATGPLSLDAIASAAQRLVNHDLSITSVAERGMASPSPLATDTTVVVMPIDAPVEGLGQCSECPEPTSPDDAPIREGDVLLVYVSCPAPNALATLVMHRVTVCLPCLRGAMNWLRDVGIAEAIIEIPRVIRPGAVGAVATPAVQRYEHERRVIARHLAIGAPAPEVSLQRWDWIVTQLGRIADGTDTDAFRAIPPVQDVAF